MRSIWAVAKNTVSQALRMKVAVVVVFLLVVLIPLMSVLMTGDGTLKGKLQTFVSYSLALTGLLLSILTIIISCFTLSNDIKRRHLQLVVCKPIFRYQIVFGKFIGVVIVDCFLMLLFGSIIFFLSAWAMPRMIESPKQEVQEVEREFYTARVSVTDPIAREQVIADAKAALDELEKKNMVPDGMTRREVLNNLIGEEIGKIRNVPVGKSRQWDFEGVRLEDPNDGFYVEFKYRVASSVPDDRVRGLWLVGDLRQEGRGANQWSTPILRFERSDKTRTRYEFAVPSEVIAADGYVAVRFLNPYINRTTVIPEEVGLLYKADSFGSNFIRALLMLLSRLIFLGALGVSLTTWVSFPTAVLASIVAYFIGALNGFIIESLSLGTESPSAVYNSAVKFIMWFLPRFDDKYSPGSYMVSGDMISWLFLSNIYLKLVLVKSLILIAIGIWIFSRREIGKITV